MGLLDYKRHFLLLASVAAVLALTGNWTQALGPIGSGAVYGSLHGATLVLTLRRPRSPRLCGVFVFVAAVQSVVAVSIALLVGRVGTHLHGALRPALLLSLCSGLGAVSYSLFIRAAFRVRLSVAAAVSIASGCVVVDLAVLSSGLYLHGGVVWFAVAWWFAMSLGLWCQDALTRTRARELIH
jgi:hypothetical protein